MKPRSLVFSVILLSLALWSMGQSRVVVAQGSKYGIFEGANDIGDVGKPGKVTFDSKENVYTVTGGGENMWFDNDELHFVWTKVDNDVSLTATIHWPTEGGDPHRKACLIIRQSLDPSAAYVDAGPDYSPDGKWIYFNSLRTGTMQIWRMKPDGSEQTQVTTDDYNDWFPHPSPDGQHLVFVSFEKDVEGHPANQDVRLRIMPTAGGEVRTIAKLYGGQGTLNVPSWSPDSRNVAFVSYQPIFE